MRIGANGDDEPSAISKAGDPDRAPVGVVEDDARLAVDQRRPVSEAALAGLAAPADQRLRHALGADERHRHDGRLAAAVAVDRGVRSEHSTSPPVAVLPGGQEPAGDLLALLARDVEAAPALLDVAVRPGEDLAAVVRALADDPRDLLVGVVEDLAQQEDGALDRRELLEQVQERERERVGGLGVPAASSATSGSGSHSPG